MNTEEKLLYNIQNLFVLVILLMFVLLCLLISFKTNSFLGYLFFILVVIWAWYSASKIKLIEVKGGKK
jgi:hypothetical protein